jgi:hypothetical protein
MFSPTLELGRLFDPSAAGALADILDWAASPAEAIDRWNERKEAL